MSCLHEVAAGIISQSEPSFPCLRRSKNFLETQVVLKLAYFELLPRGLPCFRVSTALCRMNERLQGADLYYFLFLAGAIGGRLGFGGGWPSSQVY